ncbi:MAG: glycoside hydrolase family 57 protein [Deltaproteobacteria bacterium]
MDNRLNIAFMWHMHQPMYKDPFTGEYHMPWVLLHGTKDYYDMAAMLEEFPQVHQTFNLVPCLIEQINEYAGGRAKDRYRDMAIKPASGLKKDEKIFMLQNFFHANWDNMIRPVARYRELLLKRGISNSTDDTKNALRYFGTQDFLDLQVLFNLVWIDPHLRSKDGFLSHLTEKGSNFTEEEKGRLFEAQIELAKKIVPKYAELKNKGLIEISTSPYYHPILPLLCDSFSAREAMPHITLPKNRFTHPEDAEAQIKKALELYRRTFNEPPSGMWPSEGSVSMDMLNLVAKDGIKWVATDEEILSNSLRRPIRRDKSGHCYDSFLYRPYSIQTANGSVAMIFRDHVLSDLIGFEYARMDPEAAASDFVSRLQRIHDMLENPGRHLVSIILDGENAWETYRNDGRDFLRCLYARLSENPKLKCVTVSEHLHENAERDSLDWVYPGSWINHNFKIWIGHIEDNTAWDFIDEARSALVRYEEGLKNSPDYEKTLPAVKEAWDALYAAEGSDWFWWYGEEHSSASDEDFDALFRRYIKRVYTLLGIEPPLGLDIPISSEAKGYRPTTQPTAYLTPEIDGEITSYFEWLAAGRVERLYFGSAMHIELQRMGLIDSISYGFSEDTLYLRFDYLREHAKYDKAWGLTINVIHPGHIKLNASIRREDSSAVLLHKPEDSDKWVETGERPAIKSNAVTEIALPLDAMGAKKGTEIRLFFTVDTPDLGAERWPVRGFLILDVPHEDFQETDWIV